MARLMRFVTMFRICGEDRWAVAVNGYIVETGSQAEMQAAYERWLEVSDD